MAGSVLDRESIRELIRAPAPLPAPLIEGYLSLEAQLQPNGFDLTLGEVLQLSSPGLTAPGNGPSTLPQNTALSFGPDGYIQLREGAYVLTLNEILNLPLNIMALARPRSSLLRSGLAIHTGVWDAGYRGRSQVLLTVFNPSGHRMAKGARILQIVFLYLARPVEEGYQGRYFGENL